MGISATFLFLKVSFYCGSNSLLKDYNFLLVHSSEKIFLQSWKNYTSWLQKNVREQCIVTDANILPGIHVSKQYRDSYVLFVG